MIGRIVGRYGAGSTLAGQEQGEMGESERRVKETDALVRETVIRLSRSGSSELLGERAHKDVLGLRPHLEEALAALADIERRRGLTDEELARWRAFKMLLAAAPLF
jgi:hypothetical protein